jgi:hypothetical protein
MKLEIHGRAHFRSRVRGRGHRFAVELPRVLTADQVREIEAWVATIHNQVQVRRRRPLS